MHLGILSPLTLLLTLTLTASTEAYKIRAFSGSGCTGTAREVNVWDNTCRDQNVPDTRSFRVLNYGAWRQRANFYKQDGCWYEHQGWWADGGSNVFREGECVDLKWNARAYGSISA
ncbi:hypothetical protein BJY04DRAFT_179587 [Aspergillus karnatakaensis]|uniref:uncharacterized protein n=1 Tax=Aspergillus karnatakaensis TaxID=1810916 RepID=UPI003CCDEA5A